MKIIINRIVLLNLIAILFLCGCATYDAGSKTEKVHTGIYRTTESKEKDGNKYIKREEIIREKSYDYDTYKYKIYDHPASQTNSTKKIKSNKETTSFKVIESKKQVEMSKNNEVNERSVSISLSIW